MALAAQKDRSGEGRYGYDLVDNKDGEVEDRFSLSFCNAFSNVCTPLCVSFQTILYCISCLTLKVFQIF